jgi:hypothetical protein
MLLFRIKVVMMFKAGHLLAMLLLNVFDSIILRLRRQPTGHPRGHDTPGLELQRSGREPP